MTFSFIGRCWLIWKNWAIISFGGDALAAYVMMIRKPGNQRQLAGHHGHVQAEYLQVFLSTLDYRVAKKKKKHARLAQLKNNLYCI
ncbi:hypothetical protein CFIMG_005834RAa [Ceratocystis fimbriata CBS 114723]|uniref:Uncharacterized protein n=1 Tax=Ceratocystis fimbriata CBS 114723 TaxID=1035309 RepID=A0A2C5WKR1_9PEZI|nr:hypothetical protein CFIMG_005834RAa [Ceratocystis fimbriata CBS 114723]